MLNKIILSSIFLISTSLNQGCAQNKSKNDQSSAQSEDIIKVKNHLGDATSPYLRQHADNPVHWFKWGDKPFKKARKEDKLVIISIGYAACHWCHVMEHKSFMDTTVARVMNENFVSIKVDREQRPDVDDTYMTAARLISGSGGWPLNAIALPNKKPVFAGTYFPKNKWIQLLKRINKIYQNNPQRLRNQANKLAQGIQRQSYIKPADTSRNFTMKDLHHYFKDKLVKNIDWEINYENPGKNKGGNKFPNPSNFEFQLHYYYLSNNQKALDAVTTTLNHMARGGIFDQVGGGFSRYATDPMWKVPHFEKMLYDNAQLVSLYSKAYQVTQNPLYKNVVTKSLEFIDRVMTSPQGGFYSSLNADSEGEEGKYYVWTEKQVDQVLEENQALVKDYYSVTAQGNWEHGKNVLYRTQPDKAFAKEHGMSIQKLRQVIEQANQKLFEARQPRTMPSKDEKIITSWNALMLQGYLDAYQAFGKEKYLDRALKNARFLDEHAINEDHSVTRIYKDGRSNIQGFLDDYSYTINAFISLYEVTFDKKWLDKARHLAEYTVNNFYDPSTGLFFYQSRQSEALISNNRQLTDNTKPSGNSAMAKALFKLSHYFYKKHEGYADTAMKMLNTVAPRIERGPGFFGNWLSLMTYFAKPPTEVAIIGDNYKAKAKELQSKYLPHSFFMGSQKKATLALLKNRYVEGQTTIYVCQNQVCQLPVTGVDKALKQIDQLLNR